jgi:hypothetical protein
VIRPRRDAGGRTELMRKISRREPILSLTPRVTVEDAEGHGGVEDDEGVVEDAEGGAEDAGGHSGVEDAEGSVEDAEGLGFRV